MMGRVSVHIGLPKTATTTLQRDVFPHIEEVHYVGVRHPRETAQDPLYTVLTDGLRTGQLDLARRELKQALQQHRHVVLSEEMILLPEPQETWRDKIPRLALLLNDLPHTLLVTVRSPARGMFSFYCELQRNLAFSRRPFLWHALHDDRLTIYRYRRLFTCLFEHFERRHVHVVPFEDLIAGNMEGLCQALQVSPPSLTIQNRNAKAKHPAGVALTVPRTLGSALRTLGARGGLSVAAWEPRLGASLRLLDRISLPDRHVVNPSDEDWEQVHALLRDDCAWLMEEFAVAYDLSATGVHA